MDSPLDSIPKSNRGGARPGAGRKKKSPIRANAQRRMAMLAPIAVETIKETVEGTQTDRLRYEAALEIYQHNFGKPKQQTDLNIEGTEALGAGMVTALYKAMMERRYELMEAERLLQLEEGRDAD